MPNHVFNAAAKFADEYPSAGTRNTSTNMFPNTIQNLEFDTEQEFNEAFGPGNQDMQSAELIALRYPIRADWQVYDGSFLRDYCMLGGGSWAAGQLPSLSFDFCSDYDGAQGDAFWGAKCNSLRLSAAQRGILSASAEFFAMHHTTTSGFSWTVPEYRPYVWAKGVWSDATQGQDIYPIGIDLTIDHNLREVYAMFASLVGTNEDYEPSHILPGYRNIRADIRALSKHTLVITDTVDVVMQFVSGANTLTVTLSNGVYRGQQRRIPADDLVEYGIPLTFQTISIDEA